ncbi:MAG TPA: hypothetical protein VMH26_12190 [Burkholderiales bacterium]|nr:hypothetical protein [Burkholderiales bacterium]
MREATVYVIRIYRRAGSRIAGLAENVRTGEARAFASAQELSAFLLAVPRRSTTRRPNSPDRESQEPVVPNSGTGRFAGVSGGGMFEAHALPSGEYEVNSTGTIEK